MKPTLQLPPAHLVTRWASVLAACLAIMLFTACRASRESIATQANTTHEEHEGRLSLGQSLFALFDTLAASHSFQADSLEIIVYHHPATPSQSLRKCSVLGDSVAETSQQTSPLSPSFPTTPLSTLPNPAIRLRVSGLHSSLNLNHTSSATSSAATLDTASIHRFGHETESGEHHTEKARHPNNSCRLVIIGVLFALCAALLLIYKIKR